MDNTEKAWSIIKNKHHSGPWQEHHAHEVSVEMAKWKDEQFEDRRTEIEMSAMKDLAWEIHKKIANGVTLAELDQYVCGICDF